MQSQSYFNLTYQDLNKFAYELGQSSQIGDIYLLYGDLGVGKTTFTKAFAKGTKVNPDDVTSPTFNLVHVYENKIWHYDLYRLKIVEEIHELGLSEAFNHGITIIEWPDIIETLIPPQAIKIFITQSKFGENLRDINLIK